MPRSRISNGLPVRAGWVRVEKAQDMHHALLLSPSTRPILARHLGHQHSFLSRRQALHQQARSKAARESEKSGERVGSNHLAATDRVVGVRAERAWSARLPLCLAALRELAPAVLRWC